MNRIHLVDFEPKGFRKLALLVSLPPAPAALSLKESRMGAPSRETQECSRNMREHEDLCKYSQYIPTVFLRVPVRAVPIEVPSLKSFQLITGAYFMSSMEPTHSTHALNSTHMRSVAINTCPQTKEHITLFCSG